MSRPMHSWELPSRAWDRPGLDAEEGFGGVGCSDSDDPADTPPTAGEEFMRLMLSLVLSRSINNRQFCELCYFAGKAGIAEAVRYGVRPGCSSGNYSRHLDPILGFERGNRALYDMDIPGHNKQSLSRASLSLPTLPPHESFSSDITEDATYSVKLAEMLSAGMPPAYTEHPVVRSARDDELVAPLALYADAVPYSQTDSVLGFWLVNLVTQRRYLAVALRKRICCKCGCKGWCTFHAVFEWLAWSVRALAVGRYPLQRHDGEAWRPSDIERGRKAGQALRLKGCVVYIKGDWSEHNTTMGFPSWRDALRPCYECNCFASNMYDFAGCSLVGSPWRVNEAADYNAACERCERRVRIPTPAVQRLVSERLRYDKRSDGPKGRALTRDIPELGLAEDDRLEPSPELRDVGLFEDMTPPFTVTFWRCSLDTITRHRSPLFSDAVGATARIMTIDLLHGLNLGVMSVFGRVAIWRLLTCGAYGRVGAADENLQVVVMVLRNELMTFYAASQPRTRLTRVSDLTLSMLGTRDAPQLKTKGAETYGVVEFLVSELRKHAATPGLEADGPRLQGAGEALIGLVRALGESPLDMPLRAQQDRGRSAVARWRRSVVSDLRSCVGGPLVATG